MNNQFEQIYEQSIRINFQQSIWTELSIWREMSTNNLKKLIKNFVKKTIYINHFEEKYQHSTRNKNYQQSNKKNTKHQFQQKYQQSIWKEISTKMFEKKVNNQPEQIYQQLVWMKTKTMNLNRYINF